MNKLIRLPLQTPPLELEAPLRPIAGSVPSVPLIPPLNTHGVLILVLFSKVHSNTLPDKSNIFKALFLVVAPVVKIALTFAF